MRLLKIITSLLFLTIVAAVAGCSEPETAKPSLTHPNSQTAPTTSHAESEAPIEGMASALLGHWLISHDNGETHCYVDETVIITVKGEESHTYRWTVVDQDEATRMITIDMQVLSAAGEEQEPSPHRELTFAPDHKSLTEVVLMVSIGGGGEYGPFTWNYLDSRRNPEAALAEGEVPITAPRATPSSEARVSPTTKTTKAGTTTSIPSGPAKVVASVKDPVPCRIWDTDGSRWDYTVTFTEKNGVPATIERMGRRYLDTSGGIWTSEAGEWFDKELVIEANGSKTYSNSVQTKNDAKGDLRGATFVFGYSGTDANGNEFSGTVTATLAESP